MTIAQEEIFGPVLSIIPYEDEDDAVGSPTTPSTASPAASGPATRTAPTASPGSCAPARSRSTAARSTRAPFGGYKQSGIGREAGVLGFEEFLEIKAIQR